MVESATKAQLEECVEDLSLNPVPISKIPSMTVDMDESCAEFDTVF